MRCESCGAEIPQRQSTCEYCGSTWDRVVPATLVAPSSTPNVFRHIRQSTAWAERHSAFRQAQLPQMPMLTTVAPLIFFVIFIAISGFIAFMALGMAGIFGAMGFSHAGHLGSGIAIIPAFMALMPAGFVILGVVMITKHRKTLSAYQNAPTVPYAVVVAAKRTEVYRGGSESLASTRYFITAQFEDGRREEFAVMTPDLYGKVAEGDAGILFVRNTYALDFDRVVA